MTSIGLIGPLVEDGKTAQKPLARLEGEHVILEHIQSHHVPSLWENIKGDDQLWFYMLTPSFPNLEAFQTHIETNCQSSDPYIYAIINRHSPSLDVIGHIALMNFATTHRSNEIGHVLFSKKMQKTTAATETIYLLIKSSFEDLNSRRVEWKTNTFNVASRKAALRFGFTYEGIFRNHFIVKGHSRDTIWFSIIESEWPDKQRVFQTWLGSTNFDQDGKQIRSLTEIAAATVAPSDSLPSSSS
jgi:RimJ/RimL family protein N-acetyltransferase